MIPITIDEIKTAMNDREGWKKYVMDYRVIIFVCDVVDICNRGVKLSFSREIVDS